VLFNSLEFFVFLPLSLLLYAVLPVERRTAGLLLVASAAWLGWVVVSSRI